MKLLFSYLRSRSTPLLSAAFLLIFAGVFALYGLPMDAVLYAAILCAALLAAAGSVGFVRFARRHRLLARIGRDLHACLPLLPEPGDAVEADYQRLLREAADGWARDLSERDARFAERMDYYTLWAHEIKTPIAAMRLRLSEEDSDATRALRADLSRVERYVEMAMCYLRLDAQSTDYVFASCDLGALARASVRKFAPQFIAGRLRLIMEDMDATALTDEKWLAFVLEQLLSNAVKYTPPGGEIEIGVAEGPVLFVRDTGAGIAPEDLPRIFEQGFTGQTGRADKRASGLGLYLCARILRALGHGIRCESRLGEGTRVEIDLTARPIGAE